jgi:hypothetical protein
VHVAIERVAKPGVGLLDAGSDVAAYTRDRSASALARGSLTGAR